MLTIEVITSMKIAVIGSGVVGLTTALELQSQFRNAQITIIADKFYKETVSYVAAGIFRPGTAFSGPSEEITRKWIYDAYQHWDSISNSVHASEAGVNHLSGYIFSSTSPSITRNPLIENILPIYRAATEEELRICPGDWKYGSFFQTLITDCGLYLPWAAKKFIHAGGEIFNRKISSFTDLHGSYDILVNCTGLEAKTLCNDRKVVPIRGQVLKVQAPWIKMAYYGDYDTYVVPGPTGSVTLGGCRNFESYDLKPNQYDYDSIKTRCEALVPSLKTAKVTDVRVGLRPHRDPVRVEYEFQDTSRGILKIVHNYGHGGYGVTTSPGTAKHAARLVRDVWTGYSRM